VAAHPGRDRIAAHELTKRRQRNILVAMCTALVAVVASVSGLNVAQQQLALDLGASQGQILWIINAYTLALAALLMPVGAIGDRWGRKPVLLAGLGLFCVANVIGASAGSTAMMITARVLAGAAAAMIMPVTLSVITSSFPPEDRARGIGIWAAFAGSGGLIGLFTSSFMIDVLTWRWTFALPVALGALSALVTYVQVPNSRERSEHPFDTVGSILSALAIGGLVLGIHEGPERGWGHSLTVAGLVVGAVSLVAFVVWERRLADPLLDVTVFRDRGLAAGSLSLAVMFGITFGLFLLVFPFFQGVLGWSALKSAVALLPMAAAMMPMSTVAVRIADKVGIGRTMIAGIAVFCLGLLVVALQASVDGGYLSVLPGLVILGLGQGIAMTPSTAAITDTLPAEKQGVASALNDTTREIGGAIGVALLGSVLSSSYRDAIGPSLRGVTPEIADVAAEGLGSAFGVAPQAGPDAPRIIDAARHAFVEGWIRSMWVGLALGVVLLVYMLVRGPQHRPRPAARAGSAAVGLDESLEPEPA
jgi:EmrB/QacA subfamily drug resistance transporter